MIVSTTLSFAVLVLCFHLTIAAKEQRDNNVGENSTRMYHKGTDLHSIPTTSTIKYKENDGTRYLQKATNNTKVDFYLYNAETDSLMTKMNDGFVASLKSWGITNATQLNIEARVSGSIKAYSAWFRFDDGVINTTDGGNFISLCGNAGSDVLMCSKMTYGKHKLSVTPYTGGAGTGQAMGTFNINIEFINGYTKPKPPASAPVVQLPMPAVTYTLFSTVTNKKITDLKNGMVVDLTLLKIKDPTLLNIQTTFKGGSKFSSVMYELNGNQHVYTDSGSILSLCGEKGNTFNICSKFTIGRQNLVVTLFAKKNVIGHAHLNFILSNSSTPVAVPTSTKIPVAISAPSKSPVRQVRPTSPIASVTCKVPKLIGNWEQVAPYPLSIAESMGARIGYDFVVVSGFVGSFDNVTKKVYALNTTDPNAIWRERDSVPTVQGFSHSAYAVDGSRMYICGAYVGPTPGPDSDICLKYDHSAPAGTQWSYLPSLPGGRGGGGMFFMKETNSLLFAAGAIRRDSVWMDYNSTWELRLDNIAAGWKTMPDILYAANHIGHVTASYKGQNRYFMLGGQKAWDEADGNVADNNEWDNNSRKWIKRRSMPYARGHISASTIPYGCGFFIVGGSINNHSRTADVTYYGIDTDSYQSIGNLTQEVNTPVCDIVYLKSGNYMYCMTGPFWPGFSYRIRIK